MEPISFQRSSWHAWVAKTGLGWDYLPAHTDICSYLRWFGIGCFKVLFFSALGLMILVASGQTFAWLGAMLVNLVYLEPVNFAMAGSVLIATVLLFLFFLAAKRACAALRNQVPPPPSFIAESVRSLKDRVCFKIRIDP